MIGTGLRQVRMALSMLLGKPFDPDNILRLVQDAIGTLEEFGTPSDDWQTFLRGPLADPGTRQVVQAQALRRTLRYVQRTSPYYQEAYASLPFAIKSLTLDTLHQIPPTNKAALLARQGDFVTTTSRPSLATRTTGTTGKPLEIWLSRYEMDLWSALGSLSLLLRSGALRHSCVQINYSLRGTMALQLEVRQIQLMGARVQAQGIIPVEMSLDALLEGGAQAPTVLLANPSYLAELVRAARRRGLTRSDFHLSDIFTGGEILSQAVSQAVEETFGAVIQESYSMTEIAPVTGLICQQGHIHPDISTGFVEVIHPETGEPAAPGELGTLVVTPYYPYRECMPLFRYDTRDVVRRLPDAPLTCDMANLPAVSNIEGKADFLLTLDGQVITTRALVEVLEALPSQPWPARFRAQVTRRGIELEVSEHVLDGLTEAEVLERLRQAQLPVCALRCVAADQARSLRNLRGDLIEPVFGPAPIPERSLARSFAV